MSAATLDPIVTDAEPLTMHDRCDRCGSAAYVRVTLTSMNDLLLCAHHSNKHLPVMHERSLVVSVRDERSRLDALA